MAVWPLNWLLTSSSNSTSTSSPNLSTSEDSALRKDNLVSVKQGGGGATASESKQQDSATTLEQVTTLLEPFKATGKLPEKARTDPSVQIKDLSDQGLSLTRLLEYVPFFVSNGEFQVRLNFHIHLLILAQTSENS